MPYLSLYSNHDIPEGQEKIYPWRFWTDEERSLVLKTAYERMALNSKEIKPYLDATRTHFYTQWLIPIGFVGFTGLVLKPTILQKAFRKHPNTGFKYGGAIIVAFTLFWLNLSPYYLRKYELQQKTLKTLYDKIGPNLKIYNDLIPKMVTSSSIDKETWEIYNKRNNQLTGTLYPEEDEAPYLLPETLRTYNIKKIIQ